MRNVALGLLAAAATLAAAQDRTEIRSLPRTELQALAGAYSVLQASLPEKPDDKSLISSAIRGMMQGADPDNGEYFTQAEYRVYTDRMRPDAGSMGLEMRTRDGQPFLVPIEAGPAAQVGIKFMDRLYAVDNTHTQGLQAHQIIDLLRGEPGTKATLTVFRESSLTVHSVTVERRAFSLSGPTLSRPVPAIALLRIPAFRAATLRDTTELVRNEWRRQPFKALILDLRGSPGGLVEASIGVAAMFLPPDVVVATFSGRAPNSGQVYRATRSDYARSAGVDPLADFPNQARALPMAVLVDEATSAGAEIVAAALKDHKRAAIFGRTTYGRASIQTVTQLPDAGAIKYTSAYWTSPAGNQIHGVGVAPTVTIASRDREATSQAAVKALLDQQ